MSRSETAFHALTPIDSPEPEPVAAVVEAPTAAEAPEAEGESDG